MVSTRRKVWMKREYLKVAIATTCRRLLEGRRVRIQICVFQSPVCRLDCAQVNPGSKAAQKGVREGDVISSINGQSTRNITNSDAHALLRNAGQTLQLGLNEECSGSPKRRIHRSVPQETKLEPVKHIQGNTTDFPRYEDGALAAASPKNGCASLAYYIVT
ncbi:hypothetical protein B7P43_G05515 [Cryptotermes secundus]|uniref:PDZ domain-containing protein n=1 Tax=Cryptotermes secundus TaxID=105785 RepID=A0A2J7RNA7_9NEOP|nr:hypothetical protein B7P43_G05515 [Cryptotermes secundus]